MAKPITSLQSTNTLGSDDQMFMRQGNFDRRISAELMGTLSWAKREDYTHLGTHTVGISFPDTESFTTYQGKVYFVNKGVTLPYVSTSTDASSESNLYVKNTREIANVGDSLISDGNIFIDNINLGGQSTNVQEGVTRLKVVTGQGGNGVELLYLWSQSGDFSSSNQVVTNVSKNDKAGFDVTTNIQTYEFTNGNIKRLRELHNTDGWNISDDGADKKLNVEAMFEYSKFNEITWHKKAKCNLAQYGEFLNLNFCGDGEVYTDLPSTTNPDGSLNAIGACFTSTTAKRIRARHLKSLGSNGASSALAIHCESPDLIRAHVTYSEYVDSGHYIKGGLSSVIRTGDNEFRSSDYSGADAGRNGAIPFETLSVGGEDWAAQDEPRTRTGRMFVKFNDFKVWCSDGSNKDVAKYTGLCEAPQIVNNIYHNINKNAEAEVDTFTAGYRAKIDNDHKNCSVKNQTILGALSSTTSSAPLTEFTRIGGSFKFEPGSINLFGILARGGYFLIENYVIDWKRDVATTNFSAINVRSSDVSYYNGNGTVGAVNYKIGSGLIDLRCPNYAGFSVSPFNEFTSKENYNIDGAVIFGGNGKVINGVKNGSMSNTKIYYADDYDVLTVDGENLFAEGNLMLDADGSHHNAAYAKSTRKNNFMDSVATEVDVSTLTGGVLDVSDTGDVIDLVGTGTITSISGGFRSGTITLRLKSGSTTITDGSDIILSASGGSNIVMNSNRYFIELERQLSSGVWFKKGGTV